MRLPPADGTSYDIALLAHLLGVLALVGGIVIAGVAFEAARRRSRPSEVALLLSLTRVGVLLVATGTPLIAAFGLWLVQLGRWGYGSGWVDASIAMFVVALVLGGLGGWRPNRRGGLPSGSPNRTPRSTVSYERCWTTASRWQRTTLRLP